MANEGDLDKVLTLDYLIYETDNKNEKRSDSHAIWGHFSRRIRYIKLTSQHFCERFNPSVQSV